MKLLSCLLGVALFAHNAAGFLLPARQVPIIERTKIWAGPNTATREVKPSADNQFTATRAVKSFKVVKKPKPVKAVQKPSTPSVSNWGKQTGTRAIKSTQQSTAKSSGSDVGFAAISSQLKKAKPKSTKPAQKLKTKSSSPGAGLVAVRPQLEKAKPKSTKPAQKPKTKSSSPSAGFAAISSQLEKAKPKSTKPAQKPKTKSPSPNVGFAAVRSQLLQAKPKVAVRSKLEKAKPKSTKPAQKPKTKSSSPGAGFVAFRSKLEKAKPKQISSAPARKPKTKAAISSQLKKVTPKSTKPARKPKTKSSSPSAGFAASSSQLKKAKPKQPKLSSARAQKSKTKSSGPSGLLGGFAALSSQLRPKPYPKLRSKTSGPVGELAIQLEKAKPKQLKLSSEILISSKSKNKSSGVGGGFAAITSQLKPKPYPKLRPKASGLVGEFITSSSLLEKAKPKQLKLSSERAWFLPKSKFSDPPRKPKAKASGFDAGQLLEKAKPKPYPKLRSSKRAGFGGQSDFLTTAVLVKPVISKSNGGGLTLNGAFPPSFNTGIALLAVGLIILSPNSGRENNVPTKVAAKVVATKAAFIFPQDGATGASTLNQLFDALSNSPPVKAPVAISSPPLKFQAIPRPVVKNKALEVANLQIENSRKKFAETSARPVGTTRYASVVKVAQQRQSIDQLKFNNQQKRQVLFEKSAVEAGTRNKQAAYKEQVKLEQRRELEQEKIVSAKFKLALKAKAPASTAATLPKSQIQYKFTDFDTVKKYPLPTLVLAVSLAAVFVTNPLPKLPAFGLISPGVTTFKEEGSSDSDSEDVITSMDNIIEDVPTIDQGAAVETNLESDNELIDTSPDATSSEKGSSDSNSEDIVSSMDNIIGDVPTSDEGMAVETNLESDNELVDISPDAASSEKGSSDSNSEDIVTSMDNIIEDVPTSDEGTAVETNLESDNELVDVSPDATSFEKGSSDSNSEDIVTSMDNIIEDVPTSDEGTAMENDLESDNESVDSSKP